MAAAVLIVDEDEGVREMCPGALARRGFTVECVSSLRAAMAMTIAQAAALVLSELHLPDGGGLELLRHLRLAGRSTPFVVVTQRATTADVVEAMRLGAADCFDKPLSPEQAVHIAETYLGQPSAPPMAASGQRARAVQAMRLIGERFRDPELTARRVAGDIGISLEHLSRLMRAHHGRSVVETIRHLRLGEAARLLASSDLLIKEIAFAAGYQRLARCERDFRRSYGCSPSDYRREIRTSVRLPPDPHE